MRSVEGLSESEIATIVDSVRFSDDGLVPAIAQQFDSGEVLMMAWMNAESLAETLRHRRVVYWSRSRGELWRKGDTSGHSQQLVSLALDCDRDTVLLGVHQVGAACHRNTPTCWDTDELAVRFTQPIGDL